jgi:hypothetical protein
MTNRSLLGLATSTLSALGATFVPMGGYLLRDWSPATVMALYLLETLVGIPLTVVRVRLLTGGRPTSIDSQLLGSQHPLQGYLVVSLGMSLVCALFMGFFLFALPAASLDTGAIKAGMQVIVFFQCVGFMADLAWMRGQGAQQVDRVLSASLGRVALLYFAVFIGVFLAAMAIEWFLWPFIVLKTIADLEQPLKVLRAARNSQVN